MRVTLGSTGSPTSTLVRIDNLDILFSYETPVAFREGWGSWVVSENLWSTTTGKHIMQETGIGPANRLPRDEFEAKLDAALTHNEGAMK